MDSRLHEIVMPAVGGGPPVTVRRFNDEAVRLQVDSALAGLAKNSAILDVRFSPDEGLRSVVAARLGGHWSVALIGDYKDNQDWAGGARVGFAW